MNAAVQASVVSLRVVAKTPEADGVVSLTLARPDGRRLPDWTPGAHIDVVLPSGMARQYSLCGNRFDAHTYRVGVLREPDGRGGSAYVHDVLAPGDVVGVGGPRNNFPLVPSSSYLFVAGGIGITPLLPMIHQADLLDADWRLLYGGRTRDSIAFRAELAAYGDRVQVVPQDEHGLLDLATFLGSPRPGVKVYCCGPPPLLAARRHVHDDAGTGQLHRERSPRTRSSGRGCAPIPGSRGWRSTRLCGGSRRCRRSSGRRPPTSRSRTASSYRPAARSSCSWLPQTEIPGTGPTRMPSTCPATRPDTSGSAWASTSASASIARLEAEALLTALAERVATIELAGPTRRHHNNTLRAWESLPVRLRTA